jgi:hypothetical protein
MSLSCPGRWNEKGSPPIASQIPFAALNEATMFTFKLLDKTELFVTP